MTRSSILLAVAAERIANARALRVRLLARGRQNAQIAEVLEELADGYEELAAEYGIAVRQALRLESMVHERGKG